MAYGNMPQQTAQTNFGYDRETDYQKLIDDAVKAQDWTRAAVYEAMRNEKIAGEGAPYQPTYNYQQYLPGGTPTAQPNGQPLPVGAAQQGVEQIDLQTSVMPQYVNPYQAELDAAIASLDPETYKRFYLQEANRSAQDVLGKYAAITGGIPSTAAVAAASQAADYQKSQLGAKLVDLNAQRAGLLMNAEQIAENNYQARISAAMSRWAQLGYADQEVMDTLGVPVGTPTSDQSYTNWSRSQAEQQVQREQAEAAKQEAYNLAMTLLSTGMMPDDATLILAGIPKNIALQLYSTTAKPTTGTGIPVMGTPVIETPVTEAPATADNQIQYGEGIDGRAFGTLQSKVVALIAQGLYNEADALVSHEAGKLSEEQASALIQMINGVQNASNP